MLFVKQELLAALAAELEQLSPGAGDKAAFESPKVAAHGDFACTAAMQLAKPLKRNPRQLAEELQRGAAGHAGRSSAGSRPSRSPARVSSTSDSSPRPSSRSCARCWRRATGFRLPAGATAQRVLVEFVSANPTGPLHVGHGRQAALGDAICNLFATQGWDVYREFYYNDAGVQIAHAGHQHPAARQGLQAGRRRLASAKAAAYNGDYIADIADDFLAKKTVKSDDREYTASGDVDDLDSIRQFAVAYLRHEQDLDLQAFAVKFDNYYLESSLYTSGRVEATVAASCRRAGKTYEQDGALWLQVHRLRRRQGPRHAQGRRQLHLLRARRGLPHRQMGARLSPRSSTSRAPTTTAPSRACAPACRPPASAFPQGYPDYVLHTMVRVMRGGEEVKISKRAGSYVTLRDLIEWTSKDAVRFFLLSRKPDTEYTFDVDLAVAKNNDNPVYYVQYAHARICSVLAAWGGDASPR